jgi:hypothetical protein
MQLVYSGEPLGEDCVLIGLESFPMGLSFRVTLCMPIGMLGPAHLRWFHDNALCNAQLSINYYYIINSQIYKHCLTLQR